VYWALACYRLLGLMLNLRLKARLHCVHLTYTLVPALLTLTLTLPLTLTLT